MDDRQSAEGEARAYALKKEHAEKLGCHAHSLPIQIDRMIQIQSSLGENFDPQKIEQVLEVFAGWESENHAFFEKAGTDFHSFPPSTKEEWGMNRRRCWITIGDILGTEDFVKVFDDTPEDAARRMESLGEKSVVCSIHEAPRNGGFFYGNYDLHMVSYCQHQMKTVLSTWKEKVCVDTHSKAQQRTADPQRDSDWKTRSTNNGEAKVVPTETLGKNSHRKKPTSSHRDN